MAAMMLLNCWRVNPKKRDPYKFIFVTQLQYDVIVCMTPDLRSALEREVSTMRGTFVISYEIVLFSFSSFLFRSLSLSLSDPHLGLVLGFLDKNGGWG